ncbi:MAG TPA: hypothetical protein VMV52_03910 [Candidatus Nanopelagicaceae bacterium]|nr:hypothetical protein [Candidatus Nanopelagicaceae bacterium]
MEDESWKTPRYLELEAKGHRDLLKKSEEDGPGLTNDEMKELVLLSPPGYFRKAGNARTMGHDSEGIAYENIEILKISLVFANENRLWLQSIACTVYLIEMHLRTWLNEMHARTFDADERITFGQLITEAERAGIDASLLARLREFNSLRNDALHHLVRGKHRYFDLEVLVTGDPELATDVPNWVFAQLPEVVNRDTGQWNY